jgi:hypothetical protein
MPFQDREYHAKYFNKSRKSINKSSLEKINSSMRIVRVIRKDKCYMDALIRLDMD